MAGDRGTYRTLRYLTLKLSKYCIYLQSQSPHRPNHLPSTIWLPASGFWIMALGFWLLAFGFLAFVPSTPTLVAVVAGPRTSVYHLQSTNPHPHANHKASRVPYLTLPYLNHTLRLLLPPCRAKHSAKKLKSYKAKKIYIRFR